MRYGRMLWTVAGVLACLIVVALSVRWLEPHLAFFPSAGETDTPRTFGVAYEPMTIDTADGERLRAWRMDAATPRARIVYFHGNGGNLSVWAPILATIVRQGYSVLAFDYRGYGLSTGRPSERALYKDVDAIVTHVWREPDRAVPLVYWGRSLGATMAAYAGMVRQPDGIIAESGFPDVRTLVRSSPPMAFLSLFSSYRFPTAEYLNRVRTPVLVMHGDRDTVIRYDLGRALFERVTGPKKFVTIRGADHNDAVAPDSTDYWTAVGQFIATCRTAQ